MHSGASYRSEPTLITRPSGSCPGCHLMDRYDVKDNMAVLYSFRREPLFPLQVSCRAPNHN